MFFSASACYVNEQFIIEFDKEFSIVSMEVYDTENEPEKRKGVSESHILDKVLQAEEKILETDHGSEAESVAFEMMIQYLQNCNRRKLNDVLYYRRVNVEYRVKKKKRSA
jgi:hypothetical protein